MAGEGTGRPQRTQEGVEWDMFTEWMRNFFKGREGGVAKPFTIDELSNHAIARGGSPDLLPERLKGLVFDGLVEEIGTEFQVTDEGQLLFQEDPHLDL